jgi:hypothetical protein
MDLGRAEKRREAKKKISAILRELGRDDALVVLEDLLADAHDVGSGALTIDRPLGDPPGAIRTTVIPPERGRSTFTETRIEMVQVEPLPVWKRIEDYCRTHPTVNGVFTTREVGVALELGPTPTLSSTFAASAVKRKSTDSDRGTVRDPRFEWIGDGAGKFRLLAPGDPRRKEAEQQSA